jgi:NTE family protein
VSDNDSGPTALVFAGGGSLGAVQVGMLKSLVSSGFKPDLVIGSSVGAINAAYLASQPSAQGVAGLESVWLRLRRRDVFPLSPFQAVRSIVLTRSSLLSPIPLRHLLEKELQLTSIEKSEIPLDIVATRLLDGAETVLSTGSAVKALLASAAIPGIFPPVEIDGVAYVDGGVASNTPVASAIELGAKRVVVLPTGSPCAAERPPTSGIGVAIHALNLLIARQLIQNLTYFEDRVELIVVPPLCPLEHAVYDFSHTAELIERAERRTHKCLAASGLSRRGIPPGLIPHTHTKTAAA